MRTTIDSDDPILKEINQLQQREGKSLGRLVSDLLALALADGLGSRARRSKSCSSEGVDNAIKNATNTGAMS